MTERLVMFGGGGHAKVVLEAYRARHPQAPIVILDDNDAMVGSFVLGIPVAGGREWLAADHSADAVMPALGENRARAALLDYLGGLGRAARSVIHPQAVISPSATIGNGSFVAAGAVLNAECRLGEGVIVNTGASIDHDCQIGAAAHIAPGARLCGGVQVGRGALIGTGAVVIPGVRIGSHVTVGAGSVVLSDLPDNSRWAGCPARRLG